MRKYKATRRDECSGQTNQNMERSGDIQAHGMFE